MFRNVDSDARKILRGSLSPSLIDDILAMPSEMTPMRTRMIEDNSAGGRLLSIGKHRNDYLGTIFSQLGKSDGILSDSSGRLTRSSQVNQKSNRSRNQSSRSGRSINGRRRKKKKKITKKQHIFVQHAIHRREANRSERIMTQPSQMFDSLNYNKFV